MLSFVQLCDNYYARYITETGFETCINEESEHSRIVTAWMCEICGDDFERVGEQVSARVIEFTSSHFWATYILEMI